MKEFTGSWSLELKDEGRGGGGRSVEFLERGCWAPGSEGLPSSTLVRTLFHITASIRPSGPRFTTAESRCRKLGSLNMALRTARHLGFGLRTFFSTSWTGHPVGDQLVTALNQAQGEAAVLQNMIISYSGDAPQRGLDFIPDQVFVNWPLTVEVGAV